jgi:hypothetical protein
MTESKSTRKRVKLAPIKRVSSLTRYRAGDYGENLVPSALIGCGYNVARPLWNDDEIDLLVIDKSRPGLLVALPIQVKTRQRPKDGRSPRIEGLLKRYVAQHPGFCLAMVDFEHERWYFVPGRKNVIKLYEAQRLHINKNEQDAWSKLGKDDEVSITLYSEPPEWLKKWLVPADHDSATDELRKRIASLVTYLHDDYKKLMSMRWTTGPRNDKKIRSVAQGARLGTDEDSDLEKPDDYAELEAEAEADSEILESGLS